LATSWIEYDNVKRKLEEIRRNKNVSTWVDKMLSIEMMLRVRKSRHCILIEKDEEHMNGLKNRMLTWESLQNPNGESDIIGDLMLLNQLLKSEKRINMFLMINFYESLNL
jgi:hypothetical protein